MTDAPSAERKILLWVNRVIVRACELLRVAREQARNGNVAKNLRVTLVALGALAPAAVLGVSPAHAVPISATYTATDTANVPADLPTINDDGQSYLSSPFTENLTVGTTTSPTTFLQVAPVSGTGTVTGNVKVGFTFTGPSGSTVTGVTSSPGASAASLSGGIVTISAAYRLFYATQTDCITWTATSCTPTNNTTTIWDTLAVSFADGAILDVNLYNWSDWNMTPSISFDLVRGPTAVPEPASLTLLGTALAGLGVIGLYRRRLPRPA